VRGEGRICRKGHLVEGDNAFPTRGPDGVVRATCRQCRKLRRRVAVDPAEGVECLICGDFLRTLALHIRIHGITNDEYRTRFPGAPMAGQIMRDIAVDLLIDRDDSHFFNQEHQEMCARGLHPMEGKNVIKDKRGGRYGRQCRACKAEAKSRWQKANLNSILAKRRQRRAAAKD
jgi:hypothetical protein